MSSRPLGPSISAGLSPCLAACSSTKEVMSRSGISGVGFLLEWITGGIYPGNAFASRRLPRSAQPALIATEVIGPCHGGL